MAIGAGSPLTLTRPSDLLRRCKQAAVDEGLAYGTQELKSRRGLSRTRGPGSPRHALAEERVTALEEIAEADTTPTYAALFSRDISKLKDGTTDRTRRPHTGRQANALAPLTLDRRAYLLKHCKEAAVEEGYKFGTQELFDRTHEIFSQSADLLEGEHACEDCSSTFEFVGLTDKGRNVRKAEGLQGRAIFPFNMR